MNTPVQNHPGPRAAATEYAVMRAKAYFRDTFEHYEVWESCPKQVTIRAWDACGDYEFFSAVVVEPATPAGIESAILQAAAYHNRQLEKL